MKVNILLMLCFVSAMVGAFVAHAPLVRIARKRNLVDNPGARKLQKRPVPVLGGVVMFFGILIGIAVTSTRFDCSPMFKVLVCMAVMLYVGTLDDISNLSPRVRFVLQIACVLFLIYGCGFRLNNFHGLWGVGYIPTWCSTLVTIVSVVGLMNAINMIDGVDGLSSGYCIMASTVFAVVFYHGSDIWFLVLAISSIAALIPFLLHNAFGRKSKMYIGNGGASLMGVVLSVFVLQIVSNPRYDIFFTDNGMGLVPFAVAVFAIPIFDTLRVMTARMLRGKSPFVGDKTHLHHLFLWLGFSHIGTSFIVVGINAAIVLLWLWCTQCGMSTDQQLYVVVAVSFACTTGLYYGVHALDRVLGARMTRAREWKASHKPNRALFYYMKRIVDSI